jgi:hypothetical protein
MTDRDPKEITRRRVRIGKANNLMIQYEKDGITYYIKQSIEPVYGVVVGDELWISYDERTQEAMIKNYSIR